jgi:hypothetical protein
MNDNGHGLMMIISTKIMGMCVCSEHEENQVTTSSHVYLPVTITERECSQSICKIKLLTRALRALGNPASTSSILDYIQEK